MKKLKALACFIVTVAMLAGGIASAIVVAHPLDNWITVTALDPEIDEEQGLFGAAYGDGTFMVTKAGNGLLKSSDGEKWGNCDISEDQEYIDVEYGNGTFVAVGYDGAISTSTDAGNSWSLRDSGTSIPLRGIAYGNNTFMVVGSVWEENGPIVVLTSTNNGATWNLASIPDMDDVGLIYSVAYGANTFVVMGTKGVASTTNNGTNWTIKGTEDPEEETIPGITANLSEAVYGNGQFVAVGGGGKILTSPDGVEWTAVPSITMQDLSSVTYGNNYYAAVGYNHTILTSPDGFVWTLRKFEPVLNYYNVTCGNNTFVAVGNYDNIVQSAELLGSISGTVSINGDDPLEGVTVELYAGGITESMQSEDDGSFSFTGIPGGTGYTITARKTGYNPLTVNNVNVTPFENRTVHLAMTEYTAPPPSASGSGGADVIVNGKTYTAGTAADSKNPVGQTMTTVTVATDKLQAVLATQGNGASVIIPVTSGAAIAAGVLTGDMLDTLKENGATVALRTATTTYSIPAAEFDTDALAAALGAPDAGAVQLTISISEPGAGTVAVVEDAAAEGGFSLVIPAVNFTVTAAYNNKTVTVDTFKTYVERTIAIPTGVDPSKVTTGIIVEPDGTVRHVPTRLIVIDGKNYAVISSLTNSTYAVVHHPVVFDDAMNSWAKTAINNMGARMIVEGIGDNSFAPDRDITRAEFAAILVRALGLAPGVGANSFSDVKATDWYCPSIETAAAYELMSGYTETTVGPLDKITREQAMVMIARAMAITKLAPALSDAQITAVLSTYQDASSISDYARADVAACIETGVVLGRPDGTLAPKAFITRAEVAAIVERLLQKSGLI